MKKRNLILPAVVLLAVLLLNSCGALFMGEEDKELVGLWRSPDWDITSGTVDDGSSYYSSTIDYCYYDFHDDGIMFMTNYTESMMFYGQEWMGFISHFDFSRTGNELKLSQYFGSINMEFIINPISETEIELIGVDSSSLIRLPQTITLTKVMDYSEADLFARAAIEEYANEN